ncbi:hypothetical protein Pfo_006114 [Paulownia fortunei]|nr:hypothetical protein Pfo_006114 [Paulownia fortunei]
MGQKLSCPCLTVLLSNKKNVNCDEKEGALPTEIVEIIQEDEAIEGSQEDQVKYIEEQMVKGQEKCDQPEEGIVHETCEEVGWTGEASQSHLPSDPTEVKEDKIPCESTEENACIVHPTPENRQFDLPMLKEELISPDDIEVTKEDEANEDKTSTQFVICQPKDHEDDAKKNIAKEVEDELISPEDIEVTKEDGATVEVAESLVLNENKTSMQFVICQPEDHEDDAKKNIAKEVEEELISPEDIEVTKEDGANVEVAEGLVLNENKTSMQFAVCQPKDHEDDLERNIEKEVEEELIRPENIEVTKEDVTNEEVDESAEVTGNKTSVEFVVGQPKQREDSVETNIVGEVEDSSETTDTGVATAKDDSIMEMSEHEEKGEDNIKDFIDETALSDEVEEISVGTGDSSMESNSEAVWPAESLQESSMEPQQVKLIDQEVEGKIQEDRPVKKEKHDSKDSQIIGGDSSFEPHQVKSEESNFQKSSETLPTVADSSQFPDGKGNSETTFIKYVVELATLKDHPTNSTRRRMLIGTLSVLSSLSCSWFFGLSFVKICLIAFLTIALSSMVTE